MWEPFIGKLLSKKFWNFRYCKGAHFDGHSCGYEGHFYGQIVLPDIIGFKVLKMASIPIDIAVGASAIFTGKLLPQIYAV